MWLIPRSLASALASACSTKESPPDCVISDDALKLWVTSSGTPTLRPFSWRGWQARRWSRHLFGPETLRLSDGNNLLAQWTSSARASRASRTPWPEAEKEPTTPAGFGRQSRTAFAWLDPESSSWKTSPGYDLLGAWLPYSQTWPRSGSVSNGTASERPTWERPISGRGCSSSQWMTPMVPNGGRAVSAEVVSSKGSTAAGKKTVGLESQVRHVWATPDCNTSTRSNGLMGPNIREQAANWPTPASRDYKGENSSQHMTKTDGRTDGRSRNHADQLPNFVMYRFSHQDQTMNDGKTSSPNTQTSRRRLNPQFVDFLMGWLPGWTNTEPTACGAEEMALYRSKLDSHLSRLLDGQELHREAA